MRIGREADKGHRNIKDQITRRKSFITDCVRLSFMELLDIMSQVKDEEEKPTDWIRMHTINQVKNEELNESSFSAYKESTDSVTPKREDATRRSYCSFVNCVKPEDGDGPSLKDSANLLHHLKAEAVMDVCTMGHCNPTSQAKPKREEASSMNRLCSIDWVKTEVVDHPFSKDSDLRGNKALQLCAVDHCNSMIAVKIKEENAETEAQSVAALLRSEDEKPFASEPIGSAEAAVPERTAAENGTVIKAENIQIYPEGCDNESKKWGSTEDGQDTSEQINETRHSQKIDALYICTDCGTSYTDLSTYQQSESFPFIPHKDTYCEANVIQHTQPMKISRKNRPLFCGVCDNCFTDIPDAVTHKRFPTEETGFNCGINIKEYASVCRHQMNHSGEETYQWTECGKQNSQECLLSQGPIASQGPVVSQDLLVSQSQRLHTGEKPPHFTECKNGFRYLPAPYVHHTIDTGEPYEGRECKEPFMSSSALMEHQSILTLEVPHEGTEWEISDMPALKQQRRIHTGGKLYACTDCKKSFRNSSALIRHQASHTEDKAYQCPDCKKCFRQSKYLKVHQKIHTEERAHECSVCTKRFMYSSDLKKHHRIHTGEKPFMCMECKKCFCESSGLREHKRVHTGEKLYECTECKKPFSNSTALIRHQRIHTGEKPYQCLECKKCFRQSTGLLRHQKIHTGEKPYRCTECDKCFRQSTALKEHQKIHTGEKAHQCTQCQKCFRLATALKEHLKSHSDAKPYECPVCKKWFKHSSYLMAHQRIHTGEKPYLCTKCNKLFKFSSDLRRHQKTHTGEKPFMCVECQKCFCRASALRHHQKLHEEEQLHECSECKKTFTCSSSFREHQRIHTQEVPGES